VTGADVAFGGNGEVRLGNRRIPGNDEQGMLVNFAGGGEALPVYSFADLVACLEAGDREYFKAAFSGKVVIIGSVLDVEDRKLTSARYVTSPDGTWFSDRCKLPVMSELYDSEIIRDTIPGAFVFATAVNNILRDETLSEVPRPVGFLIVTGASLLACWAMLSASLSVAAIAIAIGLALWAAISIVLFHNQVVVPLINVIVASAVASGIVVSYRFMVSDRARRKIQRAFGYYLPPTIVQQMVENDSVPELGGETREVSIYFSDIAGFTSACEGMSAAETVRAMNVYFEAVTEVIEAHAGCICMYMGDAVVAMFGAPLDDPEHARHAVAAALAVRQRAETLGTDLRLKSGTDLHIRTGIATGSAVIGNIGSARRYNYTAMGDTVNLAARLESANKFYGTSILISDTTMSQLGQAVVARPIERVRVQGRDAPVELYEPIGNRSELTGPETANIERFEKVAKLRDQHDFAAARAILGQQTNSALEALIASHLATWETAPPAHGEVPVFNLPDK